MTPKTLKRADSFRNEVMIKAAEIITNEPDEDATKTINSPWVARGIALEAEAIACYEFITGKTVERVTFIEAQGYGVSPDGLVGDDGGLEIKVVKHNTQLQYIVERELPATYRLQVLGSLLVTGRAWWDFLSYSPGMKPFIIRTQARAHIKDLIELKSILFTAIEEVHEVVKEYREITLEVDIQ
jgi:hypothetical protein